MQKCDFRPLNATLSLSSRSFEVKFMHKVPLTNSNVSIKFCCNNQNRFGEMCKNVIQTFKMAAISQAQNHLRSNFADKVPITPRAICLPSFIAITKTYFSKKVQKCDFRPLHYSPYSRGQGRLKSHSRTRCASPLAMSPKGFAEKSRLDLEKSAKI